MLLDVKSRSTWKYTNNNGFSTDPLAEHQALLDYFKISWTPEEKRIFTERFIQHGKNFAAVAMYLPRKTTADCVQFYYLTKKSEKYKNLLRRQHRRRGSRFYKPLPMPKLEDINKDSGLIAQATLCPVGSCSTARRRVRPSRTLPPKWYALQEDQRRLLCQEFRESIMNA
ncbi:unnamed protein product [Soboliphyme baturini]|uniref:SANT domain-containing protein n=1 Tax=Soboliphyme baturini TaxID=241478 RepID=A0A183J5F7_9BILA|nr:unnamed protein product [Soboliphyme baturini]